MTKTVTFEKIVGGGMAMGYLDGKACFAAGPLPGEVCRVSIIKDKPTFMEVAVQDILEPASQRGASAEDHYLVCSPWQNVDYGYQVGLKQAVLAEAFAQTPVTVGEFVRAARLTGYRNKLEFSVKPGEERLDLAFHARGSYEDLMNLPEGCRLGTDDMNAAALALVERAHYLKLDGYVETLTVRRSVGSGTLLGHIALHQTPQRVWDDLVGPEFACVAVSRVRRRVDHELVWESGGTTLTEKLGGNRLSYPYDGFFQTNVEMFDEVLSNILRQVPAGMKVVDLYGGVGTIGLAAARFAPEVVGVEINASSVAQALRNASAAGLANYSAVAVPAQRLDHKVLDGAGCVIVDPPRAGLEARVIESLIEAAPGRIIYLSCNPVTQARDVQRLAGIYKPGSVTGYDLYPGTLHLESLLVLDRI